MRALIRLLVLAVVVAASVEKAALMGDVAKRYNASDRQVNGS